MEIEINFRPVNNEFDYLKVDDLVKEFNYDSRKGLNTIVFGIHYTEIEEPYRLLHQIEKALDFNLSKLDYWNSEVDADFTDLSEFKEFLENLKTKLTQNADFYNNIQCREFEDNYLKNGFLNDVEFLIELCKLYLKFSAKEIQLESR